MLALQAVRAWPGAGAVDPAAALLSVTLTGATVLTGWAAAVLALAALDLAGALTLQGRRVVGARAAIRVGTVLVAVTTLPVSTAQAGTPGRAGTPEPTWSEVVATRTAPDRQEEGDGREAAEGDRSEAETEGDGSEEVALDPPPEPEPALPDGGTVPLPGWTPAPPTGPPKNDQEVRLVSSVPRESLPDHVVVRRGDTLWDIAARHLGPGADVQDVAEEWPRWYAANRDLIGPDPDLILPGQELAVPRQEVGSP